MGLVPIKLPPGVWRNGTEYQSASRWWDANLVRWVQGVIRPIGGWVARTAAAFTGKARGIVAWRDNANARHVVIGTSSKLYAVNEAYSIADITPAAFTAGNDNAQSNVGYGASIYGSGAYGVPRPDTGSIIPAASWQMDNWGELWVGCHNIDGKLYEWNLSPVSVATAVTGAPTGNRAVLVTAERILVALGAGGDRRKIQWSDQENRNQWTPSSSNRAGSWNLVTQGTIECGLRVKSGNLVLTDLDAHLMTYVGMPYVYGFDRIGSNNGVIGPHAAAEIDGIAVWMGLGAFFMYDGTMHQIPCDVADYVFTDLNEDQKSKVYAFVNSAASSEIWWLYPSGSSLEVDRYVVYNRLENHWTIGTLARTCGADRGAFINPLMVGTDGLLYAHESGFTYGGATLFVESGPFELGNGDTLMDVDGLVPDEKTQGDCAVVFKNRLYPNKPEVATRTYSTANPTSVRFQARQTRIRVQGARLGDWRWGTPRLNVQNSGNER
jgi:hypothetical protein